MSNVERSLGRLNPLARRAAAAAALALTVLLASWWWMQPVRSPVPSARPEDDPAPIVQKPVTKPSFDIVRVAADGMMVIAGRAAENAEVTVCDGGREIGRTRADEYGQWVLTPDVPLAAGARELTLSARTASGQVTQSEAAALLVIPARAAVGQAPAPIAVLIPTAAATAVKPQVLQAPTAGGRTSLALDLIDYDEHSAIRFTGRAAPGASVQLYIDNAGVGNVMADARGAWSIRPDADVAPGRHMLRLDQVLAAGRVQARVELPFEREAALAPASTSNAPSAITLTHVVVQPGQTLWRIARRAYGEGVRYTVIFEANRDHIGDPARIYPGQTVAIPLDKSP